MWSFFIFYFLFLNCKIDRHCRLFLVQAASLNLKAPAPTPSQNSVSLLVELSFMYIYQDIFLECIQLLHPSVPIGHSSPSVLHTTLIEELIQIHPNKDPYYTSTLARYVSSIIAISSKCLLLLWDAILNKIYCVINNYRDITKHLGYNYRFDMYLEQDRIQTGIETQKQMLQCLQIVCNK